MATQQKPAGKNFRGDFKIIVIGTSGTGKTSFVNKWTKNIFNETYKATIPTPNNKIAIIIKSSVFPINHYSLSVFRFDPLPPLKEFRIFVSAKIFCIL